MITALAEPQELFLPLNTPAYDYMQVKSEPADMQATPFLLTVLFVSQTTTK